MRETEALVRKLQNAHPVSGKSKPKKRSWTPTYGRLQRPDLAERHRESRSEIKAFGKRGLGQASSIALHTAWTSSTGSWTRIK